jgi:hypothetical protein
MIVPISSFISLQAPTESTPMPPQNPVPFNVHDHVTLSAEDDRDDDINAASA